MTRSRWPRVILRRWSTVCCTDWCLGTPFGIVIKHILIPPGGIVKRARCNTIRSMPNLWIIFPTGLIAGGLTCAAVQGGLLATTIAQQKNDDPARTNTVPVLSFLLAKLFAYTV